MSTLLAGINTQIANQLEEVNTAFYATVISVSGSTVAVEMISQRVDTEGDTTDDVPVYNLPIYMPSTSSSTIRFPVKVGDTVLCIVNQSNLDNVKSQATSRSRPLVASPTTDYRRFNAMDAFAIPLNLRALNDIDYNLPISQEDLAIVHNVGTGQEAHVVIKPTGDVEIESQFTVKVKAKDISLEAQQEISLKAQTMNIQVPNTSWTGNYTMTGQAVFNGIPFSTHKHTGVTAGNGTSATPVA